MPTSDDAQIIDVDGTAVVRFTETDTFAIELTVEKDNKVLALTATRLPDERMRVCEGADRCVTLERQFDSYSYELR